MGGRGWGGGWGEGVGDDFVLCAFHEVCLACVELLVEEAQLRFTRLELRKVGVDGQLGPCSRPQHLLLLLADACGSGRHDRHEGHTDEGTAEVG